MDAQTFRFFQKSSKNASYHGLWSKMPLGSLQEPAKSLPGASQEPFKGPQEAPKSLQEAPCSLLRAVSEAPKRPVSCSRCQVSGVRCQVPGARCQVPSVRCQVSGDKSKFRNATIGTGSCLCHCNFRLSAIRGNLLDMILLK